jgi:hypothetical protein
MHGITALDPNATNPLYIAAGRVFTEAVEINSGPGVEPSADTAYNRCVRHR